MAGGARGRREAAPASAAWELTFAGVKRRLKLQIRAKERASGIEWPSIADRGRRRAGGAWLTYEVPRTWGGGPGREDESLMKTSSSGQYTAGKAIMQGRNIGRAMRAAGFRRCAFWWWGEVLPESAARIGEGQPR